MTRSLLTAIVLVVAPSMVWGMQIAPVLSQAPEPAAPQSSDVENQADDQTDTAPDIVPSDEAGSEGEDDNKGDVEEEVEENSITDEDNTDAAEPTIPEGYQEVTDDRWFFAVPSDWQNVLSEPVEVGEDTSLVAQFTDSQRQTVVNLVVQSYKGDNNDYLEQSVGSLSDLGYTIHTQETLTLPGLQGIDLDVSLDSSEPPTRILQRIIADNGTGFALACGGKEENFEAARSICTTILNSFRVTPR